MTNWASITAEAAPVSCCFTRNSYKFRNYRPVRYVTGCLPKISVSSCSSLKIPLSLLPKWISPGDLRHENVRSWACGGKEEKYTAVLSVAVSDKRLKTSNFLCSLPSQETQHWASSSLSLALPIRPGASKKEKSYSKWEPNTEKLWYLDLINLPKTFPLLALFAGFPPAQDCTRCSSERKLVEKSFDVIDEKCNGLENKGQKREWKYFRGFNEAFIFHWIGSSAVRLSSSPNHHFYCNWKLKSNASELFQQALRLFEGFKKACRSCRTTDTELSTTVETFSVLGAQYSPPIHPVSQQRRSFGVKKKRSKSLLLA